ncbi:response regulator [Massilia sp. PAMC28688]|uniref:hybrid sensor histidine kinase/response regulator n=1 Tax=Massilia sp. PAMC28688 TaxID=2861283 RepID=UPI001C6273E2|nr:ATP-binding protein [Massilia sp. PAMC28688]QYF93531.1 response regulator [Massilia sp. PAMC28688]
MPASRPLPDDVSREELLASEARYRALVEANSAIVWTTPPSGEFTAPQPGWSAYTGQPLAQLLGWGWLDAIHPDDRDNTVRSWRDAMQRRALYVCEHRLRGADGQYRYMSARAAPILHADGTVKEWLGIHIDIDERKRGEERLRLLDAMSQATRSAVDPRSIMDITTRMLGQHLDATRCPYADVEADNDSFTIRHDWTAPGASSTVGNYSLDLFGARAAGEMRAGATLCIRDVDAELDAAAGAAMFNAIDCKAIICCPLVKEGKLVAMMAVHQDRPRAWTAHEVALVEETVERSWVHIERVRATEALREADRRKSEFLAILAHELRNPLAPIRNGLQVMRLAGDDMAAMQRVRAMMERQVGQMVDLVNDLLDVARITRGEFELKRRPVLLAELVSSAVETSRPLIDQHHHALSISLPDIDVWLDADPTRISQVISNVLNNAAKYTPPSGRIALKAWCEDDGLVLQVSDNGPGIAPEAEQRVFDMFSQLGSSAQRDQGGLGIGLSVARRLMQLHDGRIDLVPRPGQAGSTFELRLPLPSAPAQAPVLPAVGAAGAPASALRVLVVDDNTDAADMLATLLDLLGHQCRVANDGVQALALAQSFVPDVAFLDIGMPGMNGYQLSERLGRLPQLSGMVRIALTGWGEQNDRARSKLAGFDHHLLKPCNLQAVEALLQELALAKSRHPA